MDREKLRAIRVSLRDAERIGMPVAAVGDIVEMIDAILADPAPTAAAHRASVGRRIREARCRLGYGLADLAERVGIQRGTLQWVEQGDDYPIADGLLARIGGVLGIDLLTPATAAAPEPEPHYDIIDGSEIPGTGPRRLTTPAPEHAAAPAVGEDRGTAEINAVDAAFMEAERKYRHMEHGYTSMRDRWFRYGWSAARGYASTPAPAAGLVTAEMEAAVAATLVSYAPEVFEDRTDDGSGRRIYPRATPNGLAQTCARSALTAALSARQEGAP